MRKKGSGRPISIRIHEGSDVTPEGCWIWRGGKSRDGYGKMSVEGRRSGLAHRASYEAFKGPIPAGLTIDHLCGNRACVNPQHLEAVTQAENNRRYKAKITHCPRGHRYDEDNTGRGSRGERYCLACARERNRVNSREKRARQRLRRAQEEDALQARVCQ